jgi:tRNA-splicing ligase RtcB
MAQIDFLCLNEPNPAIQQALMEIGQLPHVRRVVVLPDVHLKQKYVDAGYKITVPSATAIATYPDVLYPQFRSRGVNCGMMLIKTDLKVEESLIRLLRRAMIQLGTGVVRRGLYRLHLLPKFGQYDISASDLEEIAVRGVPAVADRFELDEEYINHVEDGGVFEPKVEGEFSYDGLRAKWQRGTVTIKRNFGLNFAGNHFLEAQRVENVWNKEIAYQWGIEEGQLVFMAHTAGIGLEAVLEEHLVRQYIKLPFYQFVTSSQPIYSIIWNAIRLLMNYGYAYRAATFVRLRDALRRWVSPQVVVQLVSDLPHNSIRLEEIDGERMHIYRHNAVRVQAGKPVIVAGSFNFNSVIGVGKATAGKTLFTADHGLGNLLKQFGQYSVNVDKVTEFIRLRRGVSSGLFRATLPVEHVVNPRVAEALALLAQDVFEPALSLRPFCTLKYVK